MLARICRGGSLKLFMGFFTFLFQPVRVLPHFFKQPYDFCTRESPRRRDVYYVPRGKNNDEICDGCECSAVHP